MISKGALGFVLTIIAMFGILAFVGIAAQSDDNGLDEVSQPTIPTSLEDRKARIEAIKEAKQIQLEERRELIIINKCENAQNRLSQLAGRIQTGANGRLTAYKSISERLHNFETRLVDRGIDISSLTEALTAYDGLVEALEEAISTYVQTLSDIIGMECLDDTNGFQAVLESAREIVSPLKDDIRTIHDFLRNDVKNALMTVKENLKAVNVNPDTSDEDEPEESADE